MRVIWVKVGEKPVVVNIPHQLEYMQELVGGLIEVVEPFSDEVVLVCNENGRNEDRPLNRIIDDQMDIRGDFFLCGQDAVGLSDMPEDKVDLYMAKFQVHEGQGGGGS